MRDLLKTLFFFTLGCCFTVTTALAAERQPDPAATPSVQVTLIDETPEQLKHIAEHRAALEQKAGPVSFDDVSFEAVFEYLREELRLDIVVNWSELELVQIERDSLVRYKSTQGSYADHLSAVLEAVSTDTYLDEDLPDFAITQSGIRVSTRRELNGLAVKRMYDIGALLREPYRPVGTAFSDDAFAETLSFHAWLRGERRYPMTDAYLIQLYKQHLAEQMREVDKLDPNHVVPLKEPQTAGQLFGQDDVPDRRDPDAFTHEAVEELVDLIKANAGDPDEWLDEDSTIYAKGEQLIIKTSRAGHEEIDRLLRGLLEAEVKRQETALKDAHATRQVAKANLLIEQGDEARAREHVRRALRIMQDHIPALAVKRLLDAMEGDQADAPTQ